MAARIFDDQGGAWSGGSREFRRSFWPTSSQMTPDDYVARALGFVVVDRFGTSVQLRLDPALVSRTALFQAFAWIQQLRFDRISVGLFRADWDYQLFFTVEQAKIYVAQVKYGLQAREAPALVCRSHDAERLPPGSAFQALVSDWRTVRGAATRATAIDFAQRHLGSRFVLTETRDVGDHLIFNTVGNGFELYGSEWASTAVGRPVHVQPDTVYGAWVSDTYDAALRNRQAILQDVDALVTAKSGQRARLRIRRAVLPLISSDGRSFVVGGSIHEVSIDLRSSLKSACAVDSGGELNDLEIASSRLINSQRARATKVSASA